MQNGRELIERAMNLESVDRIPAMYQYLAGGPEPFNAIGLQMKECYYDPVKFARACKAVRDAFDYDNIMAGWGCILLEAHAHGTRLEFPRENSYPQSRGPVLDSLEKVDSLQPVDPWDNPLLRVRLQASRILVDELGTSFAVMGNMLAPAMLAWELRGYEQQLMDMLVEPELAHSYMRVITESVRIHGERLFEQGVDMVFLEDDFTAGPEYLSLEMSQEFDLDYAKISAQDLRRTGHMVMVHNCSSLPMIAEQAEVLRPHALHYNACNVPEHPKVAKSLSGRVCLCPGIPEGLVYEGPVDKIKSCVRRVAGQMPADTPFIMGSAYEVPFRTPPEHQKAMVRTIHSLSRGHTA
ncbi:MAG: uroporphyrinogen decarboxylase family protein [Candidatus Methanomethylophilaceae archaeon]